MSWRSAFALVPRPPDSRPMRLVEQEIRDELDFHIEMRTRDNVAAGMSPEQARQDALWRFGDVERTYKACRQTLLGERIMLQRIQAVLTLVLLVAVIFLGVDLYRGQRANEAATALLMKKNEEAAALMLQKSEAASALMMQRLEKIAERPAGDTDAAAPVVVETTPRNGDTNVDPALSEIRVTYNKEMMDLSWSWCHAPGLFAESGPPHYEADRKTCVLPVKLEPGKPYTLWLNSETFGNFKDAGGRSAVPYSLQFATRPTAPGGKPPPPASQSPPALDRPPESLEFVPAGSDEDGSDGTWHAGYGKGGTGSGG